MTENVQSSHGRSETVHLARKVLATFLITFMSARIIVLLIMTRAIPDLFLHVKGTHVHHLNYGIFLLSGVGAYLIFRRPVGRSLRIAAVFYGVGMALTFDEFGMWIHLGGSYWQRASWDAIVLLSGGFGLLAFAPSIKQFRPHNWIMAIVLVIMSTVFLWLLYTSFQYAGRELAPELEHIESTSPE